MRKLFNSLFLLLFAFSISYSNDYFEQSASLMFDFYHSCMAPLKDPISQCQFSPSCSEYSKQAVNEYGITIGIALTADRLIRCSGGHASYEDYPFYKKKFIDKPHNNSLFGDGRLWSLGFSSSSYSENVSNKKNDSVFSFANHLFEKGEIQLSKLELLRIQYFNQDTTIKEKTNLLLAMNDYLNNKGLNSLEYLSKIESLHSKELKYNYLILTYIVSDFQNLNSYNINLCNKYYDSSKSEVFDKLLAYSYFRDSDLNNSLKKIDLLSNKFSNLGYDTIASYMKANFEKKIKSPFWAGIMSAIVPGTGYAYAGRIKEGASALIVNALLGVGIYSLVKTGNTGSAILTSMVTIPFYFGNIIGSANAAETVNNKHQQIVLSNLRNALGISFQFSTEQLKEFWF